MMAERANRCNIIWLCVLLSMSVWYRYWVLDGLSEPSSKGHGLLDGKRECRHCEKALTSR